MNRYANVLLVLVFLLGLGGCLHDDGYNNVNDGDDEEEASGVDFTSFVKATLEIDSQLEPRPVNNVDFEFNDKENREAYNDVVDD